MTTLNIFEEKRLLEEKLKALEEAALKQKMTALETIKQTIEENHISYRDILPILNELKMVQSSDREFIIRNSRKYVDPVSERSWDGGAYVPSWILENIDKLDEWLTTDITGKKHTRMALRLLGRSEHTGSPITVERVADSNWTKQNSEQFNQFFANGQLDILKEKYQMMNEANQAAIFAYLAPEVQAFINNDFRAF